ncbi:MAG: S8 family serine peptidase [Candidatus Zixiibacteriota bacterium]|nr:MAG: S8 family serine peptidase [candidate division Zixibacteria bacterium]
MRKPILLSIGLMAMAAVFMLGGCSQDSSTAPDTSPAVLSQKATTSPGTKDVFIGFSGDRPDEALSAVGGAIKREYRHLPIVYVTVPENAIEGLRKNANIRFVEEPVHREYHAQTLDWGVDRIDAEYVHATSGNRGAGVNVAVLDTGGDMDHPDLTWAGGHSVVNSDPNYWEDKNGHGTHCSGIVSADDNDIGVVGVAPECNMWMVQISTRKFLMMDDIIAGIDYCYGTHFDADPNNDIQVMSMSFGGPGSSAEELALQACYDIGILLVTSAGNTGGAVTSPADYECVMAVSAIDANDNFYTYSAYGPEIEITAPGVRIYSTYKMDRYRILTGTSMACPMVAGAAALVMSDNPGWTHEQVRAHLKATAEDIGLSTFQQGSGLVDCENAVLGTTSGDN